MSLYGRLFLSLSVLGFVVMTVARWILGGWQDFLYFFLILFVAGLVGGLICDFRLCMSFLRMRTARDGLSMGMSLLLALVLCVSVAYLSLHFEKSIDVTEEKINSLSEQSLKLLKSLKEDMDIRVFYIGQGRENKNALKPTLMLYKKNSPHIRIRYHDAHLENALAGSYLKPLPEDKKRLLNQHGFFVFVEYRGKKAYVDPPFDEEKITSAMIQSTRLNTRSIYILSGHGERDMDNTQAEGLSFLKESLEMSSFKLQVVNFLSLLGEGKSVTQFLEKAHALVIAGPERPFLPKEKEWLREYLEQGGRLLAALDPDSSHNLGSFFKPYGLIYKGHYVLDHLSRIMGLGPDSVYRNQFDTLHPITTSLSERKGSALFHIVSPLEAGRAPEGFRLTRLVMTGQGTLSVTDLHSARGGKTQSHTVALLLDKEKKSSDDKTQGKHQQASHFGDNTSSDGDRKDPVLQEDTALPAGGGGMKIALFGDSDFMSNKYLSVDLNRDLIMNTVSYLAGEQDLVSIRPKRLKATALTLTQFNKKLMAVFAITVPVLLFILALGLWLKRRGA